MVAQRLLVFAPWAYSLLRSEHTQEGHHEEAAFRKLKSMPQDWQKIQVLESIELFKQRSL